MADIAESGRRLGLATQDIVLSGQGLVIFGFVNITDKLHTLVGLQVAGECVRFQ